MAEKTRIKQSSKNVYYYEQTTTCRYQKYVKILDILKVRTYLEKKYQFYHINVIENKTCWYKEKFVLNTY